MFEWIQTLVGIAILALWLPLILFYLWALPMLTRVSVEDGCLVIRSLLAHQKLRVFKPTDIISVSIQPAIRVSLGARVLRRYGPAFDYRGFRTTQLVVLVRTRSRWPLGLLCLNGEKELLSWAAGISRGITGTSMIR